MDDGEFRSALSTGDLAAVRRCPKADLHNHFVLGGSRDFLRQRTGRDIAPLTRPLGSMAEMHGWVENNVGDLFAGAAGRLLGFEAALVQAGEDGVTRLILGEDVWAITLFENAARLTEALRRIHRETAPRIDWVPELGLSRHCPPAALDKWIAPFLELGFYRALDLYGDEQGRPIEEFVPIYRRAKAAGLRLRAHVGEWGSADDVRRAVELLELDEVQHGIAAADSPAVMRFLADTGVQLNICPTSNLLLGRVPNLEGHPIRLLYDAGVRVTVNTDDVLVFGRGVSQELIALHQAGLFSPAELDQIRRNGLSEQPGRTP